MMMRSARCVCRESGGGGDFLADPAPHQLQAGRLEREGDRSQLFRHRPTVQQAGAGRRRRQPGHDPRQRRLAGAVVPVNEQAVAMVYGECDVPQCRGGPRCPGGVGMADILDLEHRHVGARVRDRGGSRSASDLDQRAVLPVEP